RGSQSAVMTHLAKPPKGPASAGTVEVARARRAPRTLDRKVVTTGIIQWALLLTRERGPNIHHPGEICSRSSRVGSEAGQESIAGPDSRPFFAGLGIGVRGRQRTVHPGDAANNSRKASGLGCVAHFRLSRARSAAG